jgi:hypothetical protein
MPVTGRGAVLLDGDEPRRRKREAIGRVWDEFYSDSIAVRRPEM